MRPLGPRIPPLYLAENESEKEMKEEMSKVEKEEEEGLSMPTWLAREGMK